MVEISLVLNGEEDLNIVTMYFHFFVIISKGCFVPSLVEIGQVVLSKKIFKFHLSIFSISLLSPFEQTWISFTYECFALGLVEIGTVVLERIFFNVYEQLVLEKKFLKISSKYFLYFIIISIKF